MSLLTSPQDPQDPQDSIMLEENFLQPQLDNPPTTISALLRRMAEELKCSICLSTIHDPYMTPCKHSFCKECILRSLQGKHNLCPLCKSHISKRSLTSVESTGKIAVAYRELLDAYEEEMGYELSQEPRQWELNASDNFTQMYPYPVKENYNATGPSRKPAWKEEDNDPGPSVQVNKPNRPTGLPTLERERLDPPMSTSESVPGIGPGLLDVLKLDSLSGLEATDENIRMLDQAILDTDQLLEEFDAMEAPSGRPRDADSDDTQPKLPNLSFPATMSTSRTSTTQPRLDNAAARRSVSPTTRVSRSSSQDSMSFTAESVERQYTLLATHLTKSYMKKNLIKLADLLRVRTAENFSEEVTHVITDVDETKNTASRTIKYFMAILKGLWLLNYKWVAASLQAKQFIPEEEFEIAGDENFGHLGTPRRARMSLARGDPPLFSHLHILLHGEFKAPSRDDIRDLILTGGGKIVTSVDDDDGGRARVEVVCEGGLEDEARRRLGEEAYGGRRLVSASWILDCVSQYEIVEVKPYWARQVPY